MKPFFVSVLVLFAFASAHGQKTFEDLKKGHYKKGSITLMDSTEFGASNIQLNQETIYSK